MFICVDLSVFQKVRRGVRVKVLVLGVGLRRFLAMICLVSVEVNGHRNVIGFVLSDIQVVKEVYVFLVRSVLSLKVLYYVCFGSTTMRGVNYLFFNMAFSVRRIISSLVYRFVLGVYMGDVLDTKILFLDNLSAKVGVVYGDFVVLVLDGVILVRRVLRGFLTSLPITIEVSSQIGFHQILYSAYRDCAFEGVRVPCVLIGVLSYNDLCAMKAYARIGYIRMVLGGNIFVDFFLGLSDGMLFLSFSHGSFRLDEFANPINGCIVLGGLLYSHANAF